MWVVDGMDAGPPYVQLANDYTGTGFIAMAQLQGTALTVESAVPMYDLTKSREDNKDAEICWYYGRDYDLGKETHFRHACVLNIICLRLCHLPSHLSSRRTAGKKKQLMRGESEIAKRRTCSTGSMTIGSRTVRV